MQHKHISILVLVAFFIFGPVQILLGQEDGKEVGRELAETAEQAGKRAQETKRLLQKDKSELKETVEQLQGLITEEEKRLEKAKQEYKELQKEKQEKSKELEEEKEAIKSVQGTVVSGVKQAESMLEHSPLAFEFSPSLQGLQRMVQEDKFPGLKEIRELVDFYFGYIKTSGEVHRQIETIISRRGKEIQAKIASIGGIVGIYNHEKECGYLQPGLKAGKLAAVPGEPSWGAKKDLKSFVQGNQGHAPVDISGGAVFKRLTQQKTWKEWIKSGGVLVWPIFFVGGLALILGLERLFFILRIRSNSDRIMSNITKYAEEENWKACKEFCQKNLQYPTCRVLKSGLEHLGETQQVLENALQEALLRQLPKLERFLPTLSVLAAISPLLGLLGTVTGMINTFQVITIFGTGDPTLMAGGISEALITTQLGLAVAIPIMFLHHFLERRVDKILSDIEEKGAAFTLTLLKRGWITPSENQDAK